jgi:hypothetical protein
MEEIRLDDYEKLVGRATGRAGNAPYPQVMGDCNPDAPTHWILNRPRLRRFKLAKIIQRSLTGYRRLPTRDARRRSTPSPACATSGPVGAVGSEGQIRRMGRRYAQTTLPCLLLAAFQGD